MSLDVKDPDLSSQAVKDLANQVYQAFSTIGVVYITNYGIPQETASLSCSSQWADPGEGPGGSGTPSLIFYKSFETVLTTPVIWRSESTTANHFL